jgi:hypothetical protein
VYCPLCYTCVIRARNTYSACTVASGTHKHLLALLSVFNCWLYYLLVYATNSWITSMKKKKKTVISEESFFTWGASCTFSPLITTVKDEHHRNSMKSLVVTKCYSGIQSHYCCNLLPQRLHQTHFNCHMRLLHHNQSPNFSSSKFTLL